jgi:hypothetical protein
MDVDISKYTMDKAEEIIQLLSSQMDNKDFYVNKVEEIVQLLSHQNELLEKQNKNIELLVSGLADKL